MSSGSAWLILFIAGLCEVGWAVGLKYTEGFSRLWPSAATLVAMAATLAVMLGSGLSLPQAMRQANLAAGVVVGKLGTATCSLEELKQVT